MLMRVMLVFPWNLNYTHPIVGQFMFLIRGLCCLLVCFRLMNHTSCLFFYGLTGSQKLMMRYVQLEVYAEITFLFFTCIS